MSVRWARLKINRKPKITLDKIDCPVRSEKERNWSQGRRSGGRRQSDQRNGR